jgi:hypothetical protein
MLSASWACTGKAFGASEFTSENDIEVECG